MHDICLAANRVRWAVGECEVSMGATEPLSEIDGPKERALRLRCPSGQAVERFAVEGDAAVKFRD